jgi:DNA polymerase I
MKLLGFDIETNGLFLEANTIHTMTVYDHTDDEYKRYDKPEGTTDLVVKKGIKSLLDADVLYGHNIVQYDLPVLMKLYPKLYPYFGMDRDNNIRYFDTLVIAKLLYPEIKYKDIEDMKIGKFPKQLIGRHSLKAWGYRLGLLKGEFGDDEATESGESVWERWSQDMSDYCEQDVRVTVALFHHLVKTFFKRYEGQFEATGDIAADVTTMLDFLPVQIEHDFAFVIGEQMNHGVRFDLSAAEKLTMQLQARSDELEQELKGMYSGFWKKVKEFTPKNDSKRFGYAAGCPMTHIKWVEFSPSSREQMIRYLSTLGWKPKVFTEKGNPKLGDEQYDELDVDGGDESLFDIQFEGDKPQFGLVKEYLKTKKILAMLSTGDKAWMKFVQHDGMIRGYVNTGGAVTRRCTHSSPNTAQTPAYDGKRSGYAGGYGKESRSLYVPNKDHVLVGCDAAGLELRCLAHYMAIWDKGKYAKAVVEGTKEDGTDAHSVNMRAADLETRDEAKTFILIARMTSREILMTKTS